MNFIVSFIFSLVIYLVLTIGSGDVLYWSKEEIILGSVLSVVTGLIIQRIFRLLEIKISRKFLSPLRWGLFLIYIFGPFFFSLIKANLTVAYRILTKRIRPGIVKISPKLKTDFGTTLLANSITLTPGTLSVDVDQENNLYVHWLWTENKEPDIKQVAGNFAKWIKIITE